LTRLAKSAPQSLLVNRFIVLDIEEVNTEVCEPIDAPPLSPSTPVKTALPRRPKWEKRLPKRLSANTLNAHRTSIILSIEIGTTDTSEVHSVKVLLDSGATGNFIDKDFVCTKGISTQSISRPIPVFNIDGSPNEAGQISEVVDVVLRYKTHSERTLLAVSNLGKQNMILGYTWLKDHNPEVDWQTREVQMNRCPPRCEGCRAIRKEQASWRKTEVRAINVCRSGPPPEYAEDLEEDETPLRICGVEYEQGDRLFMTRILSEPVAEDLRATSTISQKLAEGARRASEMQKGLLTLPDCAKGFELVFAKEDFDILPEHRQWDHAIELIPGSEPKSSKVYPLSLVEQKELDSFLEENLRTGRICPSKSPMAAPVFFIKKKDGSLRLVQDYRALNSMMVKNKYPLPLISELISQLCRARYFTKLDVRWGFNNVRIKPGDEWKAAFWTNRGLFEPLVMFFGMTNSPATFQTMMNDIFQDLIAEGIMVVYLDDILIFTRTEEEHAKAIRQVLQVLQEHKLFLCLEKYEFCKEQIEYLGLVISENEVSMDPVKVAGVREWPTPENKMDIQAFLGFINFYRRFIRDFSAKARPLFDLTRSKQVWTWSGREQTAFEDLKMAVTTAPVLMSPQDSEPFRVEADSSDFATGAVLSQQSTTDGKWHPIAFYSKSLSSVEQNYKIHDKEMLAIIRVLEEWRHFLEGATHPVEIWTDHKNLEYFMTAKKLNHRQAHWSLHLARFDFLLHHRPRHAMGKPDALSRRADHGNGASDNENIVLLRPEFLVVRALEGVELTGVEQKILSDIRKGNWNGDQEEPIARAARELWNSANGTVHSSEWSNIDGLLRF